MPNASGLTPVKVITWPYQWVYAPAYRALLDVRDAGFSFDFVTEWDGNEFSTDAAVRDALFQSSKNSLAIALCEPPPFDNTNRNHRIIPLLWRLPVWLFGPKHLREELQRSYDSDPPTSEAASRDRPAQVISGVIPPSAGLIRDFLRGRSVNIYQYHTANTTTGTVGLRLLTTLAMSAGESVELPKSYGRLFYEMEQQASKSPSCNSPDALPVAVSYTPLHFIRNDIAALFEVAGVRNRVSAFIFRENDFDRGAERLFQELQNRLKGVLLRLYASADPYAEAVELIQQCDNEAANAHPSEVPTWCQGVGERATLVTAFVRRGCYFPYESMEANLMDRICYLAEAQAKKCQSIVSEALPLEIQRSLSSSVDWWRLRAQERLAILLDESYEAEIRANVEKPNLAELILHTKDYILSEPDEALGRAMISCSLGATTLQNVTWVHKDIEPDIIAKQLQNSVIFRCKESESKGFPFYCTEINFPCRACILMGGQAALLWQIHAYLSDYGLTATTREELKEANVDQTFRCSPFQWIDFKPVCDIFLNSFDAKDSKSPIGVFLLELQDNTVKFGRHVALCLGSCEKQRDGSAGDWASGTLGKLQKLLDDDDQTRTLRTIYCWRRAGWNNGDISSAKQWTFPPSGPSSHTILDRIRDHKALTKFMNQENLQFCVVAEFEVGAGTEEGSKR